MLLQHPGSCYLDLVNVKCHVLSHPSYKFMSTYRQNIAQNKSFRSCLGQVKRKCAVSNLLEFSQSATYVVNVRCLENQDDIKKDQFMSTHRQNIAQNKSFRSCLGQVKRKCAVSNLLEFSQSATYVVNVRCLENQDDIKKDDFGIWRYSGSHPQVFKVLYEEEEDGYKTIEKCSVCASGSNVVLLRRLHCTHPSNADSSVSCLVSNISFVCMCGVSNLYPVAWVLQFKNAVQCTTSPSQTEALNSALTSILLNARHSMFHASACGHTFTLKFSSQYDSGTNVAS